MSVPLLSIVTVVYNSKEALLKTYQSIKSQGNLDYEWVVIDGGSSDGTIEFLDKVDDVSVTWVSEPDKGIYDAMNKGLRRATGRYVQFLNAGDIFHDKSSLKAALEFLTETESDIICMSFEIWSKVNPRRIFTQAPKDFTESNLKLYGTGTCNHQSMFVRRVVAPFYSIDYKLKGELNWYFDLIDIEPRLNVTSLTDIILVNYELGGAGNIRYKQNLFEWVRITMKRYGLYQVMKSINAYKRFIRYSKSVRVHYQ